jgi:hypothetical protein
MHGVSVWVGALHVIESAIPWKVQVERWVESGVGRWVEGGEVEEM